MASLPIAVVLGCGGGSNAPVSPDLRSDSPAVVELGVGQSAVVDGVEIRFTEVTEDSRCAIDVVCVWSGNGAVLLRLSRDGQPSEPVTVNTDIQPRSIEWGGLAIGIVQLEPRPVSTMRIDPREYRVELEVSRTEPR